MLHEPLVPQRMPWPLRVYTGHVLQSMYMWITLSQNWMVLKRYFLAKSKRSFRSFVDSVGSARNLRNLKFRFVSSRRRVRPVHLSLARFTIIANVISLQQAFIAPLALASPVYHAHGACSKPTTKPQRNHNETTNETTRIFTHNQRNRWFL